MKQRLALVVLFVLAMVVNFSFARPVKMVKRGATLSGAVHKDITLNRGDSITVLWTGKNGGRYSYVVPMTRKGAAVVVDLNITVK